MPKFLHAADIHLDSPLRGLQRYEGAPVEEIRQASRRALENLVQLALDQSVAFVLIAGDLYDGDWKDHRTGLYFVSQMVRLREAGIPVIAIAGNHDAANKMTRTLPLPENVHLLDHKKPETFLLEQPGVAIHGQSFATPSVLEDLSAAYPPAVGGMLNIGLLHTCATGREGHQPYAPCTIPGLISKHYDYWALGHAHGWARGAQPRAGNPDSPRSKPSISGMSSTA
jgi:DNA repair exonuclease SbcCD nuclease subunit